MSDNKISPLEKIEGAAFPVLAAPFNGEIIYVKVRCLNSIQLMSCGDFSIINLSDNKEVKEASEEDIIKTINYQEKLLIETLVSPTYNEIVEKVYGKDHWVNKKKETIELLKEKIKSESSLVLKSELEKEVNNLEMISGFLLPSDFTGYIVSWALDIDRSDIKKVTRDMLLQAAILAKQGNNNPSDHLKGNFNEFHLVQLNKSSWYVYNEYMEEKRIEEEARKKGFNVFKRG